MRAGISIPLLMIFFSPLLKDREKDNLATPDQSSLSTVRLHTPGSLGIDKGRYMGVCAIVPQTQQFLNITNEQDWIKYICTKSKINIALFNATKRLGFNCPWPEAPSSSIDWPCQNARQSVINSACKVLSRWAGLRCGIDGEAVFFVPNTGANHKTCIPHYRHKDT
jgi:hypothetical protein